MKLNFKKELSNFDLEEICHKLGIRLNGIFMRNTMPENLTNGNYILNMDDSNGNGTHWTSFIKHGKTIYYCDSFGMPPPQDQVDIFHKKQDHVYYNDSQFQDIQSVVCGFYCIAFFLYVKVNKGSLSKKVHDFGESFSDNEKENDKKIQHFISKYYN